MSVDSTASEPRLFQRRQANAKIEETARNLAPSTEGMSGPLPQLH